MKEYIKFGIVLLIISSVSAGLLDFVNKKTNPIIKERELNVQIEARKSVYKEANFFDEDLKVETDSYTFIPAFNDKKLLGYVVNGVGQGYGGEINFTLAFSQDGKIKGLKILSAKETPGLGDKIFRDEWLKLWVDRDKNYEFKVGADSFAGATISPNAVYKEMINILDIYEKKVKNNEKHWFFGNKNGYI